MRPEASPPRKNVVLIVEDDPWTRVVMTALLAGEGYAVVETGKGEDGLNLAATHRPDVVLLDLALPTMSGLDVLHALKQDPTTAAIPVVVVSAYGSLMKDTDTRHVAAVVGKPFDYDDLLRAIEGALDRASAASPAEIVPASSS